MNTTPTPSGRRRRAGADKRLEALDGIIAVIAERGIESTRFVDISNTVGVAVSTLQYWFGSREDMLVEAFLHMNRRDVALFIEVAEHEQDPWRRLERLIRFDFGLLPKKPKMDQRAWLEFWAAALRNDEILTECRQVYGTWRQPYLHAIEAGIEQAMFTPVISPELIVTDLISTMDGATVPMMLGHDYFDLSAFVDNLLRRLADSLRFAG